MGEDDIKRISIKEFREKGYLQEINRLFLHRLGLAVEVIIEENGEERLGGIWDYREDPEGITYDLKHSDPGRIQKFRDKCNVIREEYNKRDKRRIEILGYAIEPIPEVNLNES
jgi:hypothetical protein